MKEEQVAGVCERLDESKGLSSSHSGRQKMWQVGQDSGRNLREFGEYLTPTVLKVAERLSELNHEQMNRFSEGRELDEHEAAELTREKR